jgi:hypothetical protein
MTDSEIMQDFFDTFEVVGKLNWIFQVENFLAGRHGLLEYAPKKDSDPRHVLSCIKMIHSGIGRHLFRSYIDLDNVAPGEGLDDVWAEWCPCPEGVELHKQDYPQGAVPLWSNGVRTVFATRYTEVDGSEEFEFGITN